MANLFDNILLFEGDRLKIQDILYFIRGNGDLVVDFEKLIPIPPELHENHRYPLTDAEKAIAQKNIEKYGYADTREFCVNEWGTQCNAFNSMLSGDKEVYFETKSAAPVPFLEKLSKKFPEVKLILRYYDDDSGDLRGICKMQNGEVILMVNDDMSIEEWNNIRRELLGQTNINADIKFVQAEIWRVIKKWALWIKILLRKKVRIRLVLCD